MAKDSDNLAKGFEAENTGGVLSGLLAEEDEFDRQTLWRLGSWAVACVSAVIVAIVASQSSFGVRREQVASADPAGRSLQIEQVAKETRSEARRLASAIETLNSDRDRLFSRIAVLEQGLDSVTGAISRQNSHSATPQSGTPAASAAAVPPNATSQSAALPSAASSSASPSVASPSVASPTAASANPVPAVAPPPTPPATPPAPSAAVLPAPTQSAEAPAAVQKPPSAPLPAPAAATTTPTAEKPPILASSAETGPTAALSTAPLASPAPPPIPPSTSLVTSKSMMAPPDSAAAKLIEPSPSPKVVTAAPEVVASVSPSEEAEEEQASPRLAVQRTEFGVDVGGANSLSGLRALWRGLLKSKSNAPLASLRPIIFIKENHNGLGMQLRLVAGPIGDAAAAAKICAAMIANDRACTTTVFEGQRLAMNPDEPAQSADGKPAIEAPPGAETTPPRKRSSKRATPREEPPPEPSTLSSIFGRKQ